MSGVGTPAEPYTLEEIAEMRLGHDKDGNRVTPHPARLFVTADNALTEIARLRAELDEALTMVVLCGNCGNRYKCKRTDLNATCPCQGKVSEPDACHEERK